MMPYLSHKYFRYWPIMWKTCSDKSGLHRNQWPCNLRISDTSCHASERYNTASLVSSVMNVGSCICDTPSNDDDYEQGHPIILF